MKKITGIAASTGIAIAKSYVLTLPDLSFEKIKIKHPTQEIARLNNALYLAKQDLYKIKNHTEKQIDADHAQIFSAHILVLSDPEFIKLIKDKILTDQFNAEAALEETANMYIQMFQNMEDAYMAERADDIKDVSRRVMSHLLGTPLPEPALINEEVILIAHNLTPSDTAQLNREFVKGFATNCGGWTSHAAIIARSLEIPAVLGTQETAQHVSTNDTVIVDGVNGIVTINPSEQALDHYRIKQQTLKKKQENSSKLKHEPTITKDGEQIELAGNIGSPEEVDNILQNGGESIGLYRTEFLYMGQNELPSEENQFKAYRSVLEQMDGKAVVIRTLDVGGDKEINYLNLPQEINPFLGYRAIRFCLANETVFRPQLRALLRASIYGSLKIIFPMVTTLDEFRKAKDLFLDEKENLKNEGIKVSDDIELGIMVEVPSTAIIANHFAKEVDFFGIGTNDLIQYTMAADRMNESVSYLYQPYHPAILHLINHVIQAAHQEGKWVKMCGEMAGESIALPILLSLGLEKFSMSAPSILPARKQFRELSKKQLSSYKDNLLAMGTAEEVLAFIGEKVK